MQQNMMLTRWNDSITLLIDIASRDIVHLTPSDTLIDAARTTARLSISSLLVFDSEERPLGIVTEYDLLCAMLRNLPAETALSEVMSNPVITVPDTINCRDAYQICLTQGIRHLVIVNDRGKAIAVVSETDFRLHFDLGILTEHTSVATAMNRVVDTLSPDESLQRALSLMASKSGSAIVITENNFPVGIITERDIARLCADQLQSFETPLRDIMAAPVITVNAEVALSVAAERMLDAMVRQLPVVDRSGRLVGLLSTRGLTRILAFKLIDNSLDREQQRSYSLLEDAPFPVVITKIRNGHIRYCNPRMSNLLGMPRNALFDVPITKFYADPSLRQTLVGEVRNQGSIVDMEIRLRSQNGKFHDTLVSSSVIQFESEPSLLSVINDITQRKKAEKTLQKERSKFQTVFRAIPDLVWLKDRKGTYLACNQTFEKFFGSPQSEILGKSDYDFVSKEQADFFRANDQKAIDAGGPVTNEEWLIYADNSFQGLFETIKTPVADADGTMIGVLGIARDITERRRTERDLRERIKEQQCLSAITVLTENIDQPLAEQLQAAAELIGPGWQFPDITAVCLECAGLRATTAGFRETPWMQSAQTANKQGEPIHLTVAYLEPRPQENEGPFLAEERHLADAIVRRLADALDRRYTAAQIHERDQMIATMFAQATDAILLVDEQTRQFVAFNSVAHQGLGYSREEFTNLSIKDFQADHSTAQIEANMQSSLDGQPVQFETWHRHKDGSLRNVTVTLRPLRLNERSMLCAVWQDVTERKDRERAIKAHTEQLYALNRYYAMLTSTSEAIVRIRDPQQLHQEICRILVNIGGFDFVWVGTVTDEGQVEPVAQAGRSNNVIQPASLVSAPESPVRTAIRLKKEHIINDVSSLSSTAEWRTAAFASGYQALGVFPILVSGQPRAVVNVYTSEAHLFGRELVELFNRLTSNVGLALEVARARAAADEEQQFRQTLLNSVAGLFYAIDTTGKLILWNRSVEEVTQRSHADLKTMNALECFREEDRPMVADRIGEAFQEGESTEEAVILARDGQQTPFVFHNRRITVKNQQMIVGSAVDISARIEAVRKLQESEKRLQGITDSALDAILMLDPSGLISYWNPAAEKILGYQAEEAIGQNLHQLLTPERYHSEHLAGFDEFQKTGNGRAVGKNLELAALRKDGQEIAVSLSMSAVFLDGAWHAVGILRDITDLKRHQAELQLALAEAAQANQEKNEILAHLEDLVVTRTTELHAANEQLRVSQERYTLALDATSDGLWDWNINDGTAYLSPNYYRMLGFEPKELPSDTKSHWLDLIHPEDRERVVATSSELLQQVGNYELEFRMRTKSGQYIWVLSRGKVVARDANNKPIRAIGIHTDLTARKQIELELRMASAEQQAIFEAAATGIVFLKNRQILRCNRQLEQIFGCTPGELTGHTTRSWYANIEEFKKMGEEVASQLKEYGRHQTERQLLRKDGSCFWARMRAQAIDPNDISKGLVGMVEDITLERQASDALVKAKEGAEAATRAKSEFLANMSHEIRTPMNAIIGFAHLLRRDPLTHRQSEQLAKLTDASRHLLQIINDILDISKIEASKMKLEIDDFEPARVIDHVCGIVAEKVAEKKLQLHVDLDHIPLMLRGDGTRLGQVLINLVGNAVKFTEKGRIDIIGRIISEDPNQVRIRFEIHDTGIGMTEDQVQRAFDSFEQADSSTTRRFGGTGLGLAISKQLVTLMYGAIGTSSTLGVGTVFWVEIPFARSAEIPVVRLPVETLRQLHTLVVDDSADAREIVACMLTELGMRTATVASGEQGLEAVLQADQQGDPYQLLIIDWQLPGLNGIETAARLQKLELSVRPAFLIMTAYSEQLPRLEAEAAGVHRIMAKPVTPSVLHDTLVEVIQPAIRYEQPRSVLANELAKRKGSHILLVEDNPVNQEVAQMVLQSMGMLVTVADNGKVAVEMVSTTPFDLVCMDVQMPIMDGLQATRLIRELPHNNSVPIVAMTANVFSEDRALCLQAGMNDHIAKPIEHEALEKLLIQWLPERQQKPEETVSGSSSAYLEEQLVINRLLSVEGLDARSGLRRMMGNGKHYIRLLSRFLEDHGKDGEKLWQLIQSENTSGVREKAHSLKGAAAALGALHVQQEAAELEAMCKTGDTKSAIQSQIELTLITLARLVSSLGEILPAAPAAAATHIPEKVNQYKLAKTLEALTELLHLGDTTAAEIFESSKHQIHAAFGTLAEQLAMQIQTFEYEDALTTVQKMRDDLARPKVFAEG